VWLVVDEPRVLLTVSVTVFEPVEDQACEGFWSVRG
jgi:hypothetical protein